MNFIFSVNGHFVTVRKQITILQACESVHCFIPRFCYQPILNIAGNCRICLVRVEGVGKPVVSCTVSVSSGMVIYTSRFFVKKAQESVLEFLLLNHPLDCPVCDQGGICDLQEQSLFFGSDSRRFFFMKRSVTNKDIGPIINIIMNRCIQCTRCVRFLNEVIGTSWGRSLSFIIAGRGVYREITTYAPTIVLESLAGNIIDLCPVGALTKKVYAFIGRPWETREVISYDLSSPCIEKVVFSTLVDNGCFVNVSSINGNWIRNQTRFAYDALNFIPRHSSVPGFYRLPFVEGVVLGGDLSLADLSAVSFYVDGLSSTRTKIFRLIPVLDKTRSKFWGGINRDFMRPFQLILLVGFGIAQIVPRLFAEIRKAFCSGRTVASFGPVDADLIIISCGNRVSDFISFVLGYHSFCLTFRHFKKRLILFSTSLFSAVYSKLWLSLLEKLDSLGLAIKFIASYVNEVAYAYCIPFNIVNLYPLLGVESRVSMFGYVNTSIIEWLFWNLISIEFYCGCWPMDRYMRSYKRLPLIFQNRKVCRPIGDVVSINPLVPAGGGTAFSSFKYSIKDILFLLSGVKFWSVPLFVNSKVNIIRANWIEPVDFFVKAISYNCLIQSSLGLVVSNGLVEQRHAYRQFQLFNEFSEFNF